MAADYRQNDIDRIIKFAPTELKTDVALIVRTIYNLSKDENYRQHFEQIFSAGITLEHILQHYRNLKCDMPFKVAVLFLELSRSDSIPTEDKLLPVTDECFKIEELVSMAFPVSAIDDSDRIESFETYVNFIEEHNIDPQICLNKYMSCLSQIQSDLKEPYLEYLLSRGATLTTQQCFDLYTDDAILDFPTDKISKMVYDQIDFAVDDFNDMFIECWEMILHSSGNVTAHDNCRKSPEHIRNFMVLFEYYLMNSKALAKFISAEQVYKNYDEANHEVFRFCAKKFIEYGVQIDPQDLSNPLEYVLFENMTPELFTECGFQNSMSMHAEDWFASFFATNNYLMVDSGLFSDADIFNAMIKHPKRFEHGVILNYYARHLVIDCALMLKIKNLINLYVETQLSDYIINICLRLSTYVRLDKRPYYEILDYVLSLGVNVNKSAFLCSDDETKSYLRSKNIDFGIDCDQ
jgi:hypothetical protein